MAEGLDFDSDGGGPIPQDMLGDSFESAAKRPRLQAAVNSDPVVSENHVTTGIVTAVSNPPESFYDSETGVVPEFGPGGLHTRELEIIDELAGDQDGIDDLDEDSDDSDYDLDDDEIDAWLEEGIEVGKKSQQEQESKGGGANAPIRRDKVVLKERGYNPFEILPEGWVTVTHNSGMPVFLHKRSRVCTLAKPYFLGPGSARKHDVPVSAVPCLHYRKELNKEKAGEGEDGTGSTSGDTPPQNDTDTASLTDASVASKPATVNGDLQEGSQLSGSSESMPSKEPLTNGPSVSNPSPDGAVVAGVSPAEVGSTAVPVKIESAEERKRVTSLGSSESVPSKEPLTNGPSVSNPAPDGTVVDGVSLAEVGSTAVPVKIESAEERKRVTSLGSMELRHYCKNLFEFQVITVKKFKTWKDRRRHHSLLKKQNRPALPGNTRLITCPIPSERGDDKKKEFVLNPSGKSFVCILHEYVQHAMRVQPRYIFKELENAQTPYSATVVINDVEYGTGYASSKKSAKMDAAKTTLAILIPEMVKVTQEENKKETEDLSFFDEINIEDPRIYELCFKAGQPSPFQILQECLKRNYGMGDTQCKMEMKPLRHQRNEFLMAVGKHEAKVVCKNKREGKQYAAQAILQLLHPHVHSWGSLLRLYGRGSCNAIREKRQEEQSITHLQVNAKANRPNTAVLDKLKIEMTKLQEQKYFWSRMALDVEKGILCKAKAVKRNTVNAVESIQSIGTFRVSSQELPANVASINL